MTALIEDLTGTVERILFHSAENGYCIVRVRVSDQKNLVTVVGAAPTLTEGDTIKASGSWVQHKTYGAQFKATFFTVCPPVTHQSIEKYLGSGLIKGIGPVYAKKLVDAFGTRVFEVIEKTPKALRKVEGIGPQRARVILKGWKDQQSVRDIMIFLYDQGISTNQAVRVFKAYGDQSVNLIRENPYRLARDIRGIGFKTADTIAQKLGIDLHSPLRARAGLLHILLQATEEEGHCGLPEQELLTRMKDILDIPPALLEQALTDQLAFRDITLGHLNEQSFVSLTLLHQAEVESAHLLKALVQGLLPWQLVDVKSAISQCQVDLDVNLAPSQQAALHTLLTSKFAVLTGGPGVGKTTLIKSLLHCLQDQSLTILLGAPTGRAAKRLSQTTGLAAKTLHRLLETDGGSTTFRFNEDNPLICDLVIVDETSMVDTRLFHALLKAMPQKAALLLVGDVDQLPSVGPGQVLRSILDVQIFPMVRLTEIFRQSAQSQIVTTAHRLNQGIMPLVTSTNQASDFYFYKVDDPDRCRTHLLDLVTTHIPNHWGFQSTLNIQVLSPMNRGALGTQGLNEDLQNLLNPQDSQAPHVERFGTRYRMDDKVMQIVNNYNKEVYNGDIGFICGLDLERHELHVLFDDREVSYDFSALDELVLAYAITIHKAQGSEYPVVVIPLTLQHYPMLRRNLVYTGITRGKQLVILVGQEKALRLAVQDVNSKPRYTLLPQFLKSL